MPTPQRTTKDFGSLDAALTWEYTKELRGKNVVQSKTWAGGIDEIEGKFDDLKSSGHQLRITKDKGAIAKLTESWETADDDKGDATLLKKVWSMDMRTYTEPLLFNRILLPDSMIPSGMTRDEWLKEVAIEVAKWEATVPGVKEKGTHYLLEGQQAEVELSDGAKAVVGQYMIGVRSYLAAAPIVREQSYWSWEPNTDDIDSSIVGQKSEPEETFSWDGDWLVTGLSAVENRDGTWVVTTEYTAATEWSDSLYDTLSDN